MDDFYRRMQLESARLDEVGLTHNSGYTPMLTRMVGKENVRTFKVMADVMEPAKFYSRGQSRDYTSMVPLNRLVDAVRPESLTARKFQMEVDAWVKGAPKNGHLDEMRAMLTTWKDNHKTLGPVLKTSPMAQEVYPQSVDLAAAATLGLEALEYLGQGKQGSEAWLAAAKKTLARAQLPRGEVEIAVLPGISTLVLTAGQWNKIIALDLDARHKLLAAQLEAIRKGHGDEDD